MTSFSIVSLLLGDNYGMPRPFNPVAAGLRFGRLVTLAASHRAGKEVLSRCRCDCGTDVTVRSGKLRTGHTQSCGCLQRDRARSANLKHGQSQKKSGTRPTSEYTSWASMLARCYNPAHKDFASYGGRGVIVCDRWRESFAAFFADMGLKPSPAHSVDRENPDGNYEALNCRWATVIEQARNKRNTLIVTHCGESRPLTKWAEIVGVRYSVLHRRIVKLGWPVGRALSTPPR
jgi:hypothetical protein